MLYHMSATKYIKYLIDSAMRLEVYKMECQHIGKLYILLSAVTKPLDPANPSPQK